MDQKELLTDYLQMYDGLGKTVGAEIKDAQRLLLSLHESAHERLLRLATQTSILFLTGWVYLLGSGNIDNPMQHKSVIGICCTLHTVTLALVTWTQWRLMRAYDDRTTGLSQSRVKIGEGALKVQNWIMQNAEAVADPTFSNKVDQIKDTYLKDFFTNERISSDAFEKRNKFTVWIGRTAILVLFSALILSLYSMLKFVRQGMH